MLKSDTPNHGHRALTGIAMRSFRSSVAGALLAAAGFASFASKDLPPAFVSGNMRLSTSMFGSGASGGDELHGLYANKNWPELVQKISQKGWYSNLYYYYLGQAAEDLGLKETAVIYYRLAISESANNSCRGILFYPNACQGIDVPTLATESVDKILSSRTEIVKKIISGSRVAGKRSWDIGAGPLIEVEAARQPKSILEVVDGGARSATGSVTRGKFESDKDYEARVANEAVLLFSTRLNLSNGSNCTSSYDHSASTYSIRCNLLSGIGDRIRSQGQTFVLANSFDAREIKRELMSTYSVTTQQESLWIADFKLSAREAETLDSDLMIAIEGIIESVESICGLCEDRKRLDRIDSISESLSGLKGDRRTVLSAWRQDAFKTGSVLEDWTHKIKMSNVLRVFVFRGSDRRLLHEETFN